MPSKSGVVAAAFALGFASLGGCATSLQPYSQNADELAGASERLALSTAAREISKTFDWPKPSNLSWIDRLAGRVSAEDTIITREDAVTAYVDELVASGQPVDAIIVDAQESLDAAFVLIETAEQALEAISPRMSDVAVLEKSIRTLREGKSIYLAAIDVLDREASDASGVKSISATQSDRARLDRASIDIRTGFDRVVRQIGGLADALADRATEKPTNFASRSIDAL